ncbi:ABC transporter permease [Pseudomonas sp. PDM31]|uniref:ABC transporter permease n=1 Tax=Pseudomonas sp. PDM31 TaxID=2854778 RepID=UPI001C48672C|nr:ABC transporter permease [Pseudomonas sp. PDM31]MBV7476246.1 ABC transporter permease [Pseudomonas sp. PDM31]
MHTTDNSISIKMSFQKASHFLANKLPRIRLLNHWSNKKSISARFAMRTPKAPLFFPRSIRLIKECTKDPATVVWALALPCALFCLLTIFAQDTSRLQSDYALETGWFYAYISLSLALSGYSSDVVKCRESVFIRCFLCSKKLKASFIISHFVAYSIISILYCLIFYLTTKLPFGAFELGELSSIVARSYICFLMFCGIGLLITFLPISTGHFRELSAIIILCLVLTGVMADADTNNITDFISWTNPLSFAKHLMTDDPAKSMSIACCISLFFICTLATTIKLLTAHSQYNRYH